MKTIRDVLRVLVGLCVVLPRLAVAQAVDNETPPPPAPPAPPPKPEPLPPPPPDLSQVGTSRVGIDLEGSYGPNTFVSMGASVHLDYRYGTKSELTFRAGYRRAIVLETDKEGFHTVIGMVGWRRYLAAPLYIQAEVGGVAIYTLPYQLRPEQEPGGWSALPAAVLTLGVATDFIDVGVSTSYPFIGIGVHVGFRFPT